VKAQPESGQQAHPSGSQRLRTHPLGALNVPPVRTERSLAHTHLQRDICPAAARTAQTPRAWALKA